MNRVLGALIMVGFIAGGFCAEVFRADFNKTLDPSWKWIREDPSGWRLKDGALEVRMQPGNMWGPANHAKNVLVRPAPDPARGEIEILATVENRPTEQYEQVDLVWYYADSHMVKIGQEQVDGKLSVVMGREEGDKTRTMSINSIQAHTVELRLVVAAGRISGYYRERGMGEWQRAGDCSLPVLEGASPMVSVQCYQGPANVERWARITRLAVRQTERK